MSEPTLPANGVWIIRPDKQLSFYSLAPDERLPQIVRQARSRGYCEAVIVVNRTDNPRDYSPQKLRAQIKKASVIG